MMRVLPLMMLAAMPAAADAPAPAQLLDGLERCIATARDGTPADAFAGWGLEPSGANGGLTSPEGAFPRIAIVFGAEGDLACAVSAPQDSEDILAALETWRAAALRDGYVPAPADMLEADRPARWLIADCAVPVYVLAMWSPGVSVIVADHRADAKRDFCREDTLSAVDWRGEPQASLQRRPADRTM